MPGDPGRRPKNTIEAGLGELKSSLIPSPNRLVKKLEGQADATVKFDPKQRELKVTDNSDKSKKPEKEKE